MAQVPMMPTQKASTQVSADQATHPYGRDLNINDPQTYFQKFGSAIPPKQTTEILLALSFFLRPPELDWENLPLAETELRKALPKPRGQTPEMFIASRKPVRRTAPLSEVTRIATSAVQAQFEARSNSNDIRWRSFTRSLGPTHVQGQLRRTRPVVSNEETDRLQNPVYHEAQRFSLGSPVDLPQCPTDDAGGKEVTAPGPRNTTPKPARSLRISSTETVRVHGQREGDGSTLAGAANSNGALNPEAPSFTPIDMPSTGDSVIEEVGGAVC